MHHLCVRRETGGILGDTFWYNFEVVVSSLNPPSPNIDYGYSCHLFSSVEWIQWRILVHLGTLPTFSVLILEEARHKLIPYSVCDQNASYQHSVYWDQIFSTSVLTGHLSVTLVRKHVSSRMPKQRNKTEKERPNLKVKRLKPLETTRIFT